nr:putative disease resistance RPP13-like protein 3 [Ipomoea batatas]
MLWNLQKLDVEHHSENETLNIWGLPQLKNLAHRGTITLVPPRSVHHNLESIRFLDYRSCTQELFMRIPNLRSLGVDNEAKVAQRFLLDPQQILSQCQCRSQHCQMILPPLVLAVLEILVQCFQIFQVFKRSRNIACQGILRDVKETKQFKLSNGLWYAPLELVIRKIDRSEEKCCWTSRALREGLHGTMKAGFFRSLYCWQWKRSEYLGADHQCQEALWRRSCCLRGPNALLLVAKVESFRLADWNADQENQEFAADCKRLMIRIGTEGRREVLLHLCLSQLPSCYRTSQDYPPTISLKLKSTVCSVRTWNTFQSTVPLKLQLARLKTVRLVKSEKKSGNGTDKLIPSSLITETNPSFSKRDTLNPPVIGSLLRSRLVIYPAPLHPTPGHLQQSSLSSHCNSFVEAKGSKVRLLRIWRSEFFWSRRH